MSKFLLKVAKAMTAQEQQAQAAAAGGGGEGGGGGTGDATTKTVCPHSQPKPKATEVKKAAKPPATPLQAAFRAVMADDVPALRALLESGAVAPDATNKGGDTLAFLAAERGRAAVLAFLSSRGEYEANPPQPPGTGDDFALEPEQQHALYLAVRDGDVATAASLLTDGGSVDLRHTVNCSPFDALWHEPGPDATCLHLAACCLQVDMVRFLLSNGANPAAVANGRKAVDCVDTIDLFAAACAQRPGDVAKVKALLADTTAARTLVSRGACGRPRESTYDKTQKYCATKL
jgi:hypothetical protein